MITCLTLVLRSQWVNACITLKPTLRNGALHAGFGGRCCSLHPSELHIPGDLSFFLNALRKLYQWLSYFVHHWLPNSQLKMGHKYDAQFAKDWVSEQESFPFGGRYQRLPIFLGGVGSREEEEVGLQWKECKLEKKKCFKTCQCSPHKPQKPTLPNK